MRIVASLATLAVAACLSAPAQAQVVSVSQVLSDCPDIDQAIACTTLATAFLDGRSQSRRLDGQIIDLVVAISEAASQDRVPRRVCLNAADGLRILATGVTSEDQAQQINDIADALCTGARTAATGRPLLFDSLGGGGAGGGSGDGGAGNGGNGGGGGGGGNGGGGNGGGGGGGGNGGGGGGGGNGGDDDGNNGHGNDDDHDDDSNPGGGGGNGNGGDHDNGHGNDDDHDDDSNPGKS